MTGAFLAWLLGNPLVAAAIAAAGAFIIGLARGRVTGARRERDKQAAKEVKARDIADEVENDVGALPGSKAREDLGKWSR